MKEIDSIDENARAFEENCITIQLFKYNKNIDEHTERLPVIFERVRIIRPYLQQTLDYMAQSERKSRLRTEVCIYLSDEKSLMKRMSKVIANKPLTEELANSMSLEDDPLSEYHLRLLFSDVQYDKAYAKRRHEIYLFDNANTNSLHIGLVLGILS